MISASPAVVEDAQYIVVRKRLITPVIIELALRPARARVEFLAGQYVVLGDVDYRRTARSYSVASAPRPDGSLRLLVTLVPGGELSGWVHRDLQAGEPVLVSGPYGSFLQDDASEGPVLYLAGGSGIAPVHSLIEAALRNGSARPATLFFSGRTPADLIDYDLYAGWETTHPNSRYLRTLTRANGEPPLGRIPVILADWFPGLHEYELYIAGPPGFVSGCAETARNLGAQPGRVHTEAFYIEPRPWKSEE